MNNSYNRSLPPRIFIDNINEYLDNSYGHNMVSIKKTFAVQGEFILERTKGVRFLDRLSSSDKDACRT